MIIRFSGREKTKVEPEEIEGDMEALRDSKNMMKLQRDRYVENHPHYKLKEQTCNDPD
jgi:hypothetical protein